MLLVYSFSVFSAEDLWEEEEPEPAWVLQGWCVCSSDCMWMWKKPTGMFPVDVGVDVSAAGKHQKGNLASPAAEYEMIQFRSLDIYMSVFLQPGTSTCPSPTDFSSPPSLRYFKHRHVLLLECVPLWHAKKKMNGYNYPQILLICIYDPTLKNSKGL